MNRTRAFVLNGGAWIALTIILAFSRVGSAEPIAGRRPNIVFILTDDQGYGDMSCHGHPILKTPNIDRLNAPGNTYFDPVILHNGVFEKTHGYCTDVFFRQALGWIETRKGSEPFFAYIACNAPHVPLQVRPEDEARYAGKVANTNAVRFLGMVANIDDNVGRLLSKLTELGLEGSTLVVFMNDNGADGGLLAGYNAGMRGGKGTAFLGGHGLPRCGAGPEFLRRQTAAPWRPISIFSPRLPRSPGQQ